MGRHRKPQEWEPPAQPEETWRAPKVQTQLAEAVVSLEDADTGPQPKVNYHPPTEGPFPAIRWSPEPPADSPRQRHRVRLLAAGACAVAVLVIAGVAEAANWLAPSPAKHQPVPVGSVTPTMSSGIVKVRKHPRHPAQLFPGFSSPSAITRANTDPLVPPSRPNPRPTSTVITNPVSPTPPRPTATATATATPTVVPTQPTPPDTGTPSPPGTGTPSPPDTTSPGPGPTTTESP